jgi:hypothetical protein
MLGGLGPDRLVGGPQPDRFNGGPGRNLLYLRPGDGDVIVNRTDEDRVFGDG